MAAKRKPIGAARILAGIRGIHPRDAAFLGGFCTSLELARKSYEYQRGIMQSQQSYEQCKHHAWRCLRAGGLGEAIAWTQQAMAIKKAEGAVFLRAEDWPGRHAERPKSERSARAIDNARRHMQAKADYQESMYMEDEQ